MRRKGSAAPVEGTIPEDGEGGVLDKNFGYGKNLGAKFELGKEVGRGHFGHTCWAKGKKGELKGQSVAVKIISKAKVCRFGMCFVFLSSKVHVINNMGKELISSVLCIE